MFVAFFVAALTAGQARADVGPNFTNVLAVARMDADCVPLVGATGCTARPMAAQLALDEAVARATWRIKTSSSYVAALRASLSQYLIEQRARRLVDRSLKAADYEHFQIALNVLTPYYSCFEGHIRTAADAAFISSDTIDKLGNDADAKCAEPKRAALQRIGYTGPDFHGFDPLADGEKPGSDTAEMLMHIEQFAISYNAALRGARWRNAIATVVVPTSTRLP